MQKIKIFELYKYEIESLNFRIIRGSTPRSRDTNGDNKHFFTKKYFLLNKYLFLV